MSKKIYSIPVVTPMNPKKITKDAVKIVNGVEPDENGAVQIPMIAPDSYEIASAVAKHMEDNPITPESIGARPDTWMPTANDVGARPNTWMPTASDVGARPNTWTPSASDVGARPNTWLPTIAEIGAAPAGYGLGVQQPTKLDSADNALVNGWYCVPDPINTGTGWLLCSSYSEKYKRHDFYNVGTFGHRHLVRWMVDGIWSEWEYINPPMVAGVEYRTTERYNGKPVYTMCVNCGAAPTSGFKSVDTSYKGLLTGVETIVSLSVFRDGGGMYSSVTGSQTTYTWSGNATAYPLASSVGQVYIILEAVGSSGTEENVRAIIKYTRS